MIRQIEEKDRELFMQLSKEFYDSDAVLHPLPDAYHDQTFQELMQSSAYAQGFMLESDGTPAGYALLAKTFSREAGGIVLWVEEIYIRPAYRGHGLGKEFFAFLFQHAGSEVKRIRLEVEPENTGAIRLYQSLGFQTLPYMQMVKEKEEE